MPKVFNPVTQQWEGEDDNPMASAADLANGPMPAGTKDAYSPEEVNEQGPDTEPDEKPIQNAMGFNPNTAMAQRYKGIVQDYKAGQAEQFDKLGQGMPQQYGTAETVDHSDEGPLSPAETAARLPTEMGERGDTLSKPGTMEHLIRQHTLGFRIPQASKDGYKNYVESSKAADSERRAAQQERAKVNQENIANRDSRTMQQMADYNRAIGPGGASGGAGGAGGSGAYAERVGGLTLLRGAGHFRPQSTAEAAESNYHNAQANWMNARPQLGEENVEVKRQKAIADAARQKQGDELRAHNTQIREQYYKDIKARKDQANQAITTKNAELGKKTAASTQVALARSAQILQMKMDAAAAKGFLGGNDESKKDAMFDKTTGKLNTDHISPGDFDVWKAQFEADYQTLLDLAHSGHHDGSVSPQVAKVYTALHPELANQ